jgi:hypothetical protein
VRGLFVVGSVRCLVVGLVRSFVFSSLHSSRKLSLLGEFPGGNQVDGLPPVASPQRFLGLFAI